MEDVFNNGFWKLCITITNDLEPAGINLLEQFHTHMLFDGLLIYDFISFDYNFSFSEISVREIAKVK